MCLKIDFDCSVMFSACPQCTYRLIYVWHVTSCISDIRQTKVSNCFSPSQSPLNTKCCPQNTEGQNQDISTPSSRLMAQQVFLTLISFDIIIIPGFRWKCSAIKLIWKDGLKEWLDVEVQDLFRSLWIVLVIQVNCSVQGQSKYFRSVDDVFAKRERAL